MRKLRAAAFLVPLLAMVPTTARADVLWELVSQPGADGLLGASKLITKDGPHFLDLTGLIAGSVVNSVTASVPLGEGYAVWWSADNVTYSLLAAGPGTDGSCDNTGSCLVTIPVGAGKNFLRFNIGAGAGGNDNLVQSLIVAVPEPGAMGLLATGLVGLAGVGFIRRRRK